jgi:hypothetical protein
MANRSGSLDGVGWGNFTRKYGWALSVQWRKELIYKSCHKMPFLTKVKWPKYSFKMISLQLENGRWFRATHAHIHVHTCTHIHASLGKETFAANASTRSVGGGVWMCVFFKEHMKNQILNARPRKTTAFRSLRKINNSGAGGATRRLFLGCGVSQNWLVSPADGIY